MLSHTHIISYVHLRNCIGRRADYKNWCRKTVESFLGKRSHLFGRSLSRARCTSRVLTTKAGTTSFCAVSGHGSLSVVSSLCQWAISHAGARGEDNRCIAHGKPAADTYDGVEFLVGIVCERYFKRTLNRWCLRLLARMCASVRTAACMCTSVQSALHAPARAAEMHTMNIRWIPICSETWHRLD